jgi:predicted dehydrogenase
MTTLVNRTETEDCVVASLEMADGSLASLSVTMGSAHEISRHRFCFENLSAESQTAPYRNSSDPWTFTGDSPDIDRQIREALAAFVPLPEHYAGQFVRLHRALATGSELPVTLADARTSIEWITAIYHAARTERPVRRPVRLPLDRAHPLYGGWQP